MRGLRGSNIISKFGDSDTISDEFSSKLINKYAKKEEVVQESKTAAKVVDDTHKKLSKRIANKAELVDLGYTSLGTGLYKDAEHHIWTLKREGEGYSVEREIDEEDRIAERGLDKAASRTVSVTGDSPADLEAFTKAVNESGEARINVSRQLDDMTVEATIEEEDYEAVVAERGRTGNVSLLQM